MPVESKQRYTLAEYFEIDRNAEIKYEYWDGQIFAMSGASPEHNEIAVNIIREISTQLKGRACKILGSDQRVKALLNPSLIIEILSDSTERFDRGDKFTFYKSIPSFCEYVLVAQHRPHITQFVKQTNNKWLQSEVNEIGDDIYLPSIDCTLVLSEVYLGVEFPPPSNVLASQRLE